MKTKITLLLIATATVAHATLIDLTLGGINSNDPLTQRDKNAINELFHQRFFDQASHGFFDLPPPEGHTFLDRWVSRFGALNGGTYFTVHDFFGHDNTIASVSWDMTGEPHGYWMTLLNVTGIEDGVLWENIYRVLPDQHFQSFGNQIVRAHEGVTINSVAFYGRNVEVPDTGSTLMLLGIAVTSFTVMETEKTLRRKLRC